MCADFPCWAILMNWMWYLIEIFIINKMFQTCIWTCKRELFQQEKNVFLGMQSYLPSAEVNCVSLIVFSGVSVPVDSFRHCVMLRSFSVCFSLSAYLVLRKFCFCTWCSAIIIYDNDIYEMSIKISICYLVFFYCRILRAEWYITCIKFHIT